MEYRVAIDPQLDLTANEFVKAWNQSQPVADSTAAVGEVTRESFLTPEMTIALVSAAFSIPTTVIATFVGEYLKKKFLEKDEPKVTVTTIHSPDGKPVWIIRKKEL